MNNDGYDHLRESADGAQLANTATADGNPNPVAPLGAEDQAQLALEAQLAHTGKLITSMLTVHPHYGDDCGEYLRSALELSGMLMSHRENGTEDLLMAFQELTTTEDHGGYSLLWNDFASDGIAKEVVDFVKSLGGKDGDE